MKSDVNRGEELQKLHYQNRLVLASMLGFGGLLVLLASNQLAGGIFCLFLGLVILIRAVVGGITFVGPILSKILACVLVLVSFFWNSDDLIWREENTGNPVTQPVLEQQNTVARESGGNVDQEANLKLLMQDEIGPVSNGEFEEPKDFINHYRRAELNNDLELVMKQYADKVDYFGEDRSRSWIKAEKAAFWETWPVRSEEISSVVNEKYTGRKEWTVTFNTSFRNENPEEKTWHSGIVANEYTVVNRNQRFYVIEQSAVLIESKKSKSQKQYGNVAPDEDLFGGKRGTVSLPRDPKESKYPRVSKATNLIIEVRRAEKERHIEGVVSGYAPSVDYFGKKKSQKELYQDKVDFYMNWPKSEENRISPFRVFPHGPDSIKVTFNSSFKYSNELEGRWRSGVFANTYIVSDASGKMLIVGQSAKISDLKKSAK